MRTATRSLALLLLLAVQTPLAAQEDAGGDAFEVTLDLFGRYVWRGWDLNHGDPVLQPGITWAPAVLAGFYVDLWGSLGLAQNAEAGDAESGFDELDVTLGYDRELPGELTLSLWLGWYHNVSDFYSLESRVKNGDDVELYLGLSAPLGERLSSSISYVRGLEEGIRGDYLEAALAAPVELGDGAWSLAPALSGGLGSQYGAGGKPMHVTAVLPASWTRWGLTVTGSLNYVVPLQDLNEDGEETLFFAGVGLAWSPR